MRLDLTTCTVGACCVMYQHLYHLGYRNQWQQVEFILSIPNPNLLVYLLNATFRIMCKAFISCCCRVMVNKSLTQTIVQVLSFLTEFQSLNSTGRLFNGLAEWSMLLTRKKHPGQFLSKVFNTIVLRSSSSMF